MASALLVTAAVAILLLALLVAGLLRARTENLRPESPGRELAAPDVSGPTPFGELAHVDVGDAGITVLLFLSSSCVTCRGIWSALSAGGVRELLGAPRVAVVTEDPASERVDRLRELGPHDLPIVMSSAAWLAYGVRAAPRVAVVEGPARHWRGPDALESWDELVAVVAKAAGREPRREEG